LRDKLRRVERWARSREQLAVAALQPRSQSAMFDEEFSPAGTIDENDAVHAAASGRDDRQAC
jgi:hypothetical protein